MERHSTSRLSLARLGIALLTLTACADAPGPTAPVATPVRAAALTAAAPAQDGEDALTILTWNAYFGGDTGPLFSLDFSNIPAVLAATNAFWGQVQASDVPGRASAIADQIEAARPHVVSLQEVGQFAVVDATTGQILGGSDVLAQIRGQLAARGLDYELVAIQEATSSTLPLAVDFSTFQITTVLAFTDRIAMLRRSDVNLTGTDQGLFDAALDLGPLTVHRGYIRASFEREGAPYHVLNTHLETQSLAPIQAAQADQLLNSVAAGLEGVTVITGDLNSDAEGAPGDASWTATYGEALAAGFVDAWKQSGQPAKDPGYTCCQAPDLRNAMPELNQRLDLVLVRASWDGYNGRRIPGAMRVDIVGEEQADRTASGLWPADHAGVIAELRIPPGRRSQH